MQILVFILTISIFLNITLIIALRTYLKEHNLNESLYKVVINKMLNQEVLILKYITISSSNDINKLKKEFNNDLYRINQDKCKLSKE